MTVLMIVVAAVMLTAMAYACSHMKHPYITAAKSILFIISYIVIGISFVIY